jgi:hypothetical protein
LTGEFAAGQGVEAQDHWQTGVTLRSSRRPKSAAPNKALQQTAATGIALPGREVTAVAAAAELGRSATEVGSMGAWGTSAWDNDSAADWFGDLFDATGLATHVEEALSRDPVDDPDVIRAAAHVLIQLGRVYIWPVHDLDNHLAQAIRKLEAVRELDEYQEAEGFVESIDAEIAELRSRLGPTK